MNEHDIGVIFLTRQEIHADNHDWRKAYERRRDKDPGDPPPDLQRSGENGVPHGMAGGQTD